MEIPIIEKTLRPDYYKQQLKLKDTYIGIGPQAYFSFLAQIDDDYLSEWELFKFKEMYGEFQRIGFGIFSLTFLATYQLSPYFLGLVSKNLARNRHYKTVGGGIMSIIAYKEINQYMIPNRNFHEVVTQPEPRGKYIRTLLKETQPRKWHMISAKLHSLGYNYKEMNEYSDKTIMPHTHEKFDNSRI